MALNDHRKVCNSCSIHVVLLITTSVTLMGIGSVYIYFSWHTLKNCFNKLPY